MSDTSPAHPPDDPGPTHAAGTPGDRPSEEPSGPSRPAGSSEAGADDLEELSDDLEPTTTGTLFIMIVFLMALAGMWGIMYLMLLER